jgi:hypothetical protein
MFSPKQPVNRCSSESGFPDCSFIYHDLGAWENLFVQSYRTQEQDNSSKSASSAVTLMSGSSASGCVTYRPMASFGGIKVQEPMLPEKRREMGCMTCRETVDLTILFF